MRFIIFFTSLILSGSFLFSDHARIEVLNDGRHLVSWNRLEQEEAYSIYDDHTGELLGITLESFFEAPARTDSYRIETSEGLHALGQLINCAYPDLSIKEWEDAAPYLMTENHPAKAILDALFQKRRVLANIDEFRASGFSTKGIRNWSGTVVATHPLLKNFLIKAFMDDQKEFNDLKKFMKRIRGAKRAQEIITAHGWEKYFKVPKKWLYLVPENPSFPYAEGQKKFILIVENMHLLESSKNTHKWKTEISKSFLDILYLFLTEGGFSDSPMAHNLPFAKDGRVAVIDTEFYDGPVPYHKLCSNLSSKMSKYWQQLIQQGGP